MVLTSFTPVSHEVFDFGTIDLLDYSLLKHDIDKS